jgi:predicted deacylase
MQTQSIHDFDPRRIAPGVKEARQLDVTHTPSGQPLRLTALLVAGAQPGRLLVVLGGLHGNEYEGPHAIMRLYAELEPADLCGALVAIPVCNVLAFEAGTRESPADGLDMNRAFPGNPKGSVTQQITYWLGERLVRHADFCIDLHSGGRSEIPILCAYVAGVGPAAELSQQIANSFGAPITLANKDALPSQVEGFARDHGVPLVYTECPSDRGLNMEAAGIYQRGVRNALRVLGMLDGALEGEAGRCLYSGGPEMTLKASVGGFFVPQHVALDYVKAGDLLGTTCDLGGTVLEEFRAPDDGYICIRRWSPSIHAGDDMVFTLVRDHPTW